MTEKRVKIIQISCCVSDNKIFTIGLSEDGVAFILIDGEWIKWGGILDKK